MPLKSILLHMRTRCPRGHFNISFVYFHFFLKRRRTWSGCMWDLFGLNQVTWTRIDQDVDQSTTTQTADQTSSFAQATKSSSITKTIQMGWSIRCTVSTLTLIKFGSINDLIWSNSHCYHSLKIALFILELLVSCIVVLVIIKKQPIGGCVALQCPSWYHVP